MSHKSSQKLIGYFMYVTSLVMPFSNYPQIHQLYATKVTSGLSLSTWVMYLIFGLIPLFYAIVNNLKPLIISNILWSIVNLIMIYGIIRFGVLQGSGSFEHLLLINNIGKALTGLGLLSVSMAFALFAHDILESERR